MEEISFVFGDRATIPAFLGRDVQKEVADHLLDLNADKLLVVTEKNVEAIYGDYFDPILVTPRRATGGTGTVGDAKKPELHKIVLPSGDACKSWEYLSQLVKWNFEMEATKRTVVVAFGGGALLNVAGLFASIAFRGMKLVSIPTTFLAMHDVVTSLKTSICFDGRKNNIGSFYAPVKILIDTAFCRSLPHMELFSGLGELAKNAALLGGSHAEGFLRALSKERIDDMNAGSGEEIFLDDEIILELVRLGIQAKMSICAVDALERTTGMIFEYGHTLSHAIEKAYGDGTVPHGVGVVYGMTMCSMVSEKLGIMSADARKEHDDLCHVLLSRWPLPEPKPSADDVMARAMRDSKRGVTGEADDEISDVLLCSMGDVLPSNTNNLHKFKASLMREWLDDMGFPSEMKAIPQPGDCLPLVAKLSDGISNEELENMGFEMLEAGFANRVCSTEVCGREVVVKRYTDLVFLRIEPEAIGAVDVHAGECGVGPKVFFSGPSGLVEDKISGYTLGEPDMHKGDHELLNIVAKTLAKFHMASIPTACAGEPMLWRTMDKMLSVVKRQPALIPKGMPTIDEICDEVLNARLAIEFSKAGIVLGHGDCKPSNVLYDPVLRTATLIDFELGGPNYRGFDLFKIFRTADGFSEDCMMHFLRAYTAASGASAKEEDLEKLSKETHRFEPLTWLEAAIFFVTLPQFKPRDTPKWNSLALDRWGKYCDTKYKLGME